MHRSHQPPPLSMLLQTQVEHMSDEAFFIELSAAATSESSGLFDAFLLAVNENIGDWLHLVETSMVQGYRDVVSHSNPDFYRKTAQRVALNVFHKINEIKNEIDIEGKRVMVAGSFNGDATEESATAQPSEQASGGDVGGKDWAGVETKRDESRALSVLQTALGQLKENLHPVLFTSLASRVRHRLDIDPGDWPSSLEL